MPDALGQPDDAGPDWTSWRTTWSPAANHAIAQDWKGEVEGIELTLTFLPRASGNRDGARSSWVFPSKPPSETATQNRAMRHTVQANDQEVGLIVACTRCVPLLPW